MPASTMPGAKPAIGPVMSARKPSLTSWAIAGAATASVVAATARTRVFLRLSMYVPLLGRSVERPLLEPVLPYGTTR
ncbi:hypothetical protein D3C86_2170290 [compost metagenome]